MVMLVSPVQPENAEFPILVILLDMVMLVSPVQPENAEDPMFVTLYSVPLYVTAAGSSIAPAILFGCIVTVAAPSFKV